MNEKRDKRGRKEGQFPWLSVSLIIIAIVLGGIAYWIIEERTTTHPPITSQKKVVEKVDYTGQTIPMTDIPVKVENGKISILLDVVKEKKMVRFDYEGNGLKIPLLSYITSGGRVVTAVSLCEPCRSTRFHIQGKTLVCNACYTEWHLETLKGIQGGCLNYPPDVIPSRLEKDRIFIDENVVLQWRPRV